MLKSFVDDIIFKFESLESFIKWQFGLLKPLLFFFKFLFRNYEFYYSFSS